MKKNNFFKRRKKVSEKKETTQVMTNTNVDFYGMGLDDVQEYHNPYLTVTDYFDVDSNLAKKVIS